MCNNGEISSWKEKNSAMASGVSQKDLAGLLALLADDTRPIEAVGALFHRSFAKADHFRIASALW